MEVEVDLEYLVALFYFSLIISFSDDLLSGGYVPIMIATIFRRHFFLRPPVLSSGCSISWTIQKYHIYRTAGVPRDVTLQFSTNKHFNVRLSIQGNKNNVQKL